MTAEIEDLYAQIGAEQLASIVAGFYRQIPEHPILGPMYPLDELKGAEERLLGFLGFRLGGPDTYIQQRGHPRLRMRHAPFAVDEAARDAWVECMDRAIEAHALDPDTAAPLRAFLAHVATFLINRPPTGT